jgi:hypothetical protein
MRDKPMTAVELKEIAERFLERPILGTIEAKILCAIATYDLEKKNKLIINVPKFHGRTCRDDW